jgi:hypothetical protein
MSGRGGARRLDRLPALAAHATAHGRGGGLDCCTADGVGRAGGGASDDDHAKAAGTVDEYANAQSHGSRALEAVCGGAGRFAASLGESAWSYGLGWGY